MMNCPKCHDTGKIYIGSIESEDGSIEGEPVFGPCDKCKITDSPVSKSDSLAATIASLRDSAYAVTEIAFDAGANMLALLELLEARHSFERALFYLTEKSDKNPDH